MFLKRGCQMQIICSLYQIIIMKFYHPKYIAYNNKKIQYKNIYEELVRNVEGSIRRVSSQGISSCCSFNQRS